MSYELILPFFTPELQGLLLDPSISDLMVNGTTGVYADRQGIVRHIPLAVPYDNDRLMAANRAHCSAAWTGLDSPEPDSQYPSTGRLTRSCCGTASVGPRTNADHPQIQSVVHKRRVDRIRQYAGTSPRRRGELHRCEEERHDRGWNGLGQDHADESLSGPHSIARAALHHRATG